MKTCCRAFPARNSQTPRNYVLFLIKEFLAQKTLRAGTTPGIDFRDQDAPGALRVFPPRAGSLSKRPHRPLRTLSAAGQSAFIV
eukprot:7276937-Prymnesium_polylepis.1